MYQNFGQFIDGKWTPSSDGGVYEVVNPSNEEILGNASKATSKDVEQVLHSAKKGLEIWKKTSAWERSAKIRKIADLIRDKKDIIANWIALEVGKPFAQGQGEAMGAADIFEWNAEETKRIYGQIVESRFTDTRVNLLSTI